MSKSYIKEAEKNLVNQAIAFQDVMKIIEALHHFGSTACKEHIGRQEFFDGLRIMRQAVYSEYVNTTSQLLMFAGIGGESALKFAKQKFEDIFGTDKYAVTQFLTQWGQFPSWFKVEDEEAFRAEAKEKIKETRKTD